MRRVELKLSRFTFHETDTLTSDLTRMLYPQQTNPIRCDSENSPAACGTMAEFPGIILLYDHRPCAVIGYSRDTGATIGISEPIVLQKATDDVYRALFGQMIRAVSRRALSEGARRLQVLLPASADDRVTGPLLTEHGFFCAADIVQWDLSVAAGNRHTPPDQCTVQHYDFATGRMTAHSEIQVALDAILKCSDDLSNQPQPTAAELLSRWHRMQAQVFVCWMEEAIAGLIACVTNPPLSLAATLPENTSTSDMNISIEYVGVVPVFRRRQIASSLIRRIPALFAAVYDAQSPRSEVCKTRHIPVGQNRTHLQALRVTAYADAANTPANSLYLRCGFVHSISRRLWCCELACET